MPVATALLRERVTVETYQGSSAYGPKFAAAVAGVRARFVGKRRAVRTRDGVDVISSGSFLLRPDVDAPAESRITRANADTYTVIDVAPSTEVTGRPWATEVLVEGPR